MPAMCGQAHAELRKWARLPAAAAARVAGGAAGGCRPLGVRAPGGPGTHPHTPLHVHTPLASMSGRGDRAGGAEALARLKQFDYKA